MSRPQVFAVDETAVQIVDGARIFDVELTDALAAAAPKVPSPVGRRLARVATISDLHVGEPGFGTLPRRHAPRARGREHYTVRAARAAIDEAVTWGAELIVVKGDITWTARPGQWERAAQLLADAPVPVVAMLGNHDTSTRGQDGRPWLEEAGIDVIVDAENDVDHVDVAGMRLAFAFVSSSHNHGAGTLPEATTTRLVESIDATPAGAGSMVLLHHYPNRFAASTRYPMGIHHEQAARLFDGLAGLERPPALVTCGHSHRHRRYRRSGIEVTEVGATKDFPGVWAGYAVHEGGLRQVVRRITEPSVVERVDRTSTSCLGLWGRWTPGLLSWRCFSVAWP